MRQNTRSMRPCVPVTRQRHVAAPAFVSIGGWLALGVAWAMLALPSVSRAELLAYYNFDDGRTVTDQVGDHDGTVIHNAGFSADTPDGSPFSLDLTATGVGPGQDYVRIGPAALGGGDPVGRDLGISETDSFTITAWVKYTASQRGIVTINQDLTSGGTDRAGITFGIDDNENLFVGIITSTGDVIDDEANTGGTFRDITTEDFVPTDEWVHIAATFDLDSDTLVGYINGLASEFYNVNPASSINDDGTDITGGMGIDWFDNDGAFTGFGSSGNGPQHADSAGDFTRLFYDGLLDEVSIWNEALTAEQIQNIMDSGVVGGPPRLQAGDADQDLDFDQIDLVKVQIAAKYLTGQAATWGEGDWDGAPGGSQGEPPPGDGVFNQVDIIAALAAGTYLTGPYAALTPSGEPGGGQAFVGSLAGSRLGNVDLIHVPEPAAVLLFSLGLAGFGLWLPRRVRRVAS